MPLTPRPLRMADAASLDHELEALQHAVAAARRNRWHGGDILQPEFEKFLSALTTFNSATDPESGPVWRKRHNSWQEVPGVA